MEGHQATRQKVNRPIEEWVCAENNIRAVQSRRIPDAGSQDPGLLKSIRVPGGVIHVLSRIIGLLAICCATAAAGAQNDVLRSSPSLAADPALRAGTRALDDALLLKDSIDTALKRAAVSADAEAALRSARGLLLLQQ